MSSAQPRKAAPRLAQPAQRYWKGKAPKGATDGAASDSDEEDEDERQDGDEDEDMPLDEVGGSTKVKKPPIGSMSVALRDVNIDDKGQVIVAGKLESGRTAMEEIKQDSEEEEEESGTDGSESEAESEEDEEEEDVKPKLQFRPVFVPKRGRVTVLEQEAEDPYSEEALARRQLEKEQRIKESHMLIAETIKREIAEKEAEEKVPDVDDADGLDPEGEFEAWRLRELGRIKRDKEAAVAREKEREEVERRRALPEEQRLQEDLERANKLREEKPKGQQKFLQKYWHKGAFHQDDDILKKHDYTRATDSTVDVSLLPKVMQVKDFGKRSRTKYTHLLDQDTTRADGTGKGGNVICFLCGGPHLKKDCPSNPMNNGEGQAVTGSNAVDGPPLKRFGLGSRQAFDDSQRPNDRVWKDRPRDRPAPGRLPREEGYQERPRRDRDAEQYPRKNHGRSRSPLSRPREDDGWNSRRRRSRSRSSERRRYSAEKRRRVD